MKNKRLGTIAYAFGLAIAITVVGVAFANPGVQNWWNITFAQDNNPL